ncbi:cation-translocating P-type ATPase [Agromyces arachidis]|uniref:cation-translocating P-type ATPase n=1 Tax=Agromyces arachidis TaxID=766966 RepID=UPI004056516C
MTATARATSDLPDPARADAEEVARRLGVDVERGLSSEDAAARLERYGPNEVRAARRTPLLRRVLAQLADPLIVLLLAAVVVSVAAWAVEGAGGWPVDAVVILAIIALNGVLGLVQEFRAEKAVAALAVMTRAHSTVLRDGRLRTLPSDRLVPGDVLVLSEGDRVGADGRLVRAAALRVAEASLTGESEPVEKDPSTLDREAPLGDRRDMVFAGTAVSRGTGRAIVTATGMSTQLGAIATMLDETDDDPTPLQREVARLGRTLGVIVVAIALVVMLTVTIVQGVDTPADFVTVLLLGVSLAVAAVPEGLPAIMSLVLALGVQRMARRNAVVKQLSSVETLGSASVVCTDKTGTLTTNEMTIQRVVTSSGTVDLGGVGYAPEGAATAHGRELADGPLRLEAQIVLGAGSLANDAQLARREGEWAIEGDPTEAAFLVAARKIAGTAEEAARYDRVGEVPFDSERKMMSTAHRHESGDLVVLSKGAPDVLLGHCTRVQHGGEAVPLDPVRRARALAEIEELSDEAFRTLAVAYRPAPELAGDGGRADAADFDESAEQDLVYAGVVGIIDPPRPEVRPAIAEARAAGIRVVMVTGDHPATAARIAKDLGIAEADGIAVPGGRIDGMDDAQLRDAVRSASVFARVAPRHKLRIVDALQAEGHIVAMTGDGVNDAPALKSADIGIAMGITGTEVAKEAADMVLADDDFATIVHAVREGRSIYDNIRKFLRYLLYSNMGEVLTVFLGVVFAGVLGFAGASDEAVVLPLLATQILWINLVTDSGPALAMGVDPEVDDVMARPPRGIHDRAIDLGMWIGIAATGLVIAVATLLTMDAFLPAGLIPGGTDSFEVARTAGFTTLVFCGLFTAFNARSTTSSAFRSLFANRWLWAATALAVALQVAVVSWPPLQVAFGTASLDAVHWAVCVGMASIVLWTAEVRKLVARTVASRRARA